MKNPSVFLSCIFLTTASLAAGAQAQTQPQAVRLGEIKDLDKLDSNWIIGICNLPGLECNKVEVPRLFERKTESGVEYYALMVKRTLYRLVMKTPGQWEILNRWSFAEYPFPRMEDGSEPPAMLDIHAALYPAGPNMWAVAVLYNNTESYSGGGAEFITSDFVVLDPKTRDIGQKQRLFAAVPFSCQKMVRACFSEKNYKSFKQCHDESSGYLTLKFAPSSTSSSYEWTATWHETVLPGGAPKVRETKTQTVAVLKQGVKGAGTEVFPFCNGGPMG